MRNLLHSILKSPLPADTTVNIIVVENDLCSYSGHIVKEFAVQKSIGITYFLETKQGLAYARNRAVAEADGSDFCCFVDDDQVVAPDWLAELVKCQREYNADGVWGANPPVFKGDVPSWIMKFYEPERFSYGTIVKKAFTNCLLIRKSFLDRIPGPFDTRLNYAGGEDSYMTSLLSKMGAVIRYNPDAVAYEVIPDERTTLKYMLRRTFRISNTELLVRSFIESDFSKARAFLRLVLRFGYGLMISIPFMIFSNEDKLKGVIKVANAAGGLMFIAGKHNRFYK